MSPASPVPSPDPPQRSPAAVDEKDALAPHARGHEPTPDPCSPGRRPACPRVRRRRSLRARPAGIPHSPRRSPCSRPPRDRGQACRGQQPQPGQHRGGGRRALLGSHTLRRADHDRRRQPPRPRPGLRDRRLGQFDSSLGADNLNAPASTYTNCTISLAHWQWATPTDMESDWGMFCLTAIHEMGHLLGHQHTLKPGNVMNPVFTNDANVPAACHTTWLPGWRAPGQR